ncbi:MAG: CRTAC1 family protein [Verrucomicrobiales bacterium]|nr:CRTAC1 family protein [Verrucomicrobiales bacterium]
MPGADAVAMLGLFASSSPVPTNPRRGSPSRATCFLGLLVAGTTVIGDTYSVQNDAEVRSQLAAAEAAQRRAANAWSVDHDFRFTNRLAATGIRFVHGMTEDSGKSEKAVHYDHGSGIAVADVDADGRPDLFFANQIGGNQLWRNTGNLRFENITERAGIALAGRVSVGACFADLDNDGDPDLVVTTVREGTAAFENRGGGVFRDVSQTAGFARRDHASGIVPVDFDRDGRLDLLVTSIGRFTTDERRPSGEYVGRPDAFSGHLDPARSEPAVLYRNLGDWKFEEVPRAAGMANSGWSGDAVAVDFDGNGLPDLYVTNMQGDDHAFVNIDGKRFEDRTDGLFGRTPWGAMGIAAFDWNLDGGIDVFVTDMHSDMTGGQARERRGYNSTIDRSKSEAWCTAQWTDAFLQGAENNIFGNAFYQRRPDGGFEEVSDRVGAETYWPWGLSVGDVNADGFEDVFVTAGMGYPFAYGINSLLLNESGKRFRAAEFVAGVEPRADGVVSYPAFELDCEGADRGHRLCQGIRGKRVVEGSPSSRSSVFVDMDGDGDLDLATNEFDGPPQIFVNDLESRRTVRFLKVVLIGSRSNRDGLGATVRVRSETDTQTRYHSGKSGYLGSSSLPLYFGLGPTRRVREIEVMWPSGRRQSLRENLPETGTIEIREAEGP